MSFLDQCMDFLKNILVFTPLMTAIGFIMTTVGLFLLHRQIEIGRRIATVQLIHDLEKEFSTYNSIFLKLKPEGKWGVSQKLSQREISDLENLASFCEKLKFFVDKKILDWPTLDLMLRLRFFTIMNNPNVLKYVIEPNPVYWRAVLDLKKCWEKKLSKLIAQ